MEKNPNISNKMEKPIFQRIRDFVNQIPPGKVASYGQIARICGHCTARMVGFAMASLPENSTVPWHRVINSQGKISPRGVGFGSIVQRQLLEEEGVVFDSDGRINFDIHGYFFTARN